MRLDELTAALEARGDVVYQEVRDLDGRDQGLSISTSFLRKFPYLQTYNGILMLSTSSDVTLLRRLTWDDLVLNINDTPFDTDDLLLALAGGRTTHLVLGSMTITLEPPKTTVINYDPHYIPLLLRLLDNTMDTLDASVGVSMANYLPTNIHTLITEGPYWTYAPQHPIVIRSSLIPPQPRLHSNIVGLDAPIPASLISSILGTNPTLIQIGIDGSTVRAGMKFTHLSVDTVWVWSDNVETREYVTTLFSHSTLN